MIGTLVFTVIRLHIEAQGGEFYVKTDRFSEDTMSTSI